MNSPMNLLSGDIDEILFFIIVFILLFSEWIRYLYSIPPKKQKF